MLRKLILGYMFGYIILMAASVSADFQKNVDMDKLDKLELRTGVQFGHRLHWDTMGLPCTRCHESDKGGKIGADAIAARKGERSVGFKWAYENCVKCHSGLKHAPVKCDGCHEMREMPKNYIPPKE